MRNSRSSSREGMDRGLVVDVENAQHLLIGAHERRAHRAAHALDQDRLALEALVGGRVVGQDRHAVFDRLARDGLGDVPRPHWRRRCGCATRAGSARRVFGSSSRIDTRSTFMIWNVKSTTLSSSAVQLLLAGQLFRDLEQQRQLLLAALRLRLRRDLEVRRAAAAPCPPTMAGTPPDGLTGSWRTIVAPGLPAKSAAAPPPAGAARAASRPARGTPPCRR